MKATEVFIKLEPKHIMFLRDHRNNGGQWDGVHKDWYDFINETYVWCDCPGSQTMWQSLAYADTPESAIDRLNDIMVVGKAIKPAPIISNEQLREIYGLDKTHSIYKFCKENGVSIEPSKSDWINKYIYEKLR